MAFARPDRETLEEAIRWADVVHFLMPFWLSLSGLKIAERLGVPHTAAFHVQPENITYTLGMGKMTGVNNVIYSFFRNSFITASPTSTAPAASSPGSWKITAIPRSLM